MTLTWDDRSSQAKLSSSRWAPYFLHGIGIDLLDSPEKSGSPSRYAPMSKAALTRLRPWSMTGRKRHATRCSSLRRPSPCSPSPLEP